LTAIDLLETGTEFVNRKTELIPVPINAIVSLRRISGIPNRTDLGKTFDLVPNTTGWIEKCAKTFTLLGSVLRLHSTFALTVNLKAWEIFSCIFLCKFFSFSTLEELNENLLVLFFEMLSSKLF
jgi:hypothetical protein